MKLFVGRKVKNRATYILQENNKTEGLQYSGYSGWLVVIDERIYMKCIFDDKQTSSKSHYMFNAGVFYISYLYTDQYYQITYMKNDILWQI